MATITIMMSVVPVKIPRTGYSQGTKSVYDSGHDAGLRDTENNSSNDQSSVACNEGN